jgi:hypothetical protein
MLAFNRSLFNREYIVMNDLKALASIIFMCNLHVTLLSKITPRYFTLYKWDIPSIQRKRRVRRSIWMTEVDRPSLFHVDSNVSACTPGRHTVQATLDLSKNIALLPVCRIETGVVRKES